MASTFERVLLRLALLIGILAVSATARPCKTLFISSFSVSFNPVLQNPTSDHLVFFEDPNPGFVTVITEVTQSNPTGPVADFYLRRPFFPVLDEPQIHRHQRPLLAFPSYDFSSLRDRTKDILSVVVALLFGVGCGALTAATMYLFWTLFANRRDYRNIYSELSDSESDNDDDFSPKKGGYVKIPAPAPVDSVPAPVKEAV